MPSLNVDLDYYSHPKTRRLVGLLGRGADGLPLRLWAYVGKVHPDCGKLIGYAAHEIESLVEWWGRPGEMVTAMEKVGFLDPISTGGWEIHGWMEHQGHLAAFKIRAEKAAKARWDKLAGQAIDASSMLQACSKHPPSIPLTDLPTNQPNRLPDELARPPDFFGTEAEAKQWARCWLQAEQPAFCWDFHTLGRYALAVGRAKAAADFTELIADSSIEKPGAVLNRKLHEIANAKARKDARGNGRPKPGTVNM